MSMYRDEHESGGKYKDIRAKNINARGFERLNRQFQHCITNVNYPFGRILRAIGKPAHQLHSAPIGSDASPPLAICSQNG